MNHKYYLTDDLDELEHVHDELLDSGLSDEQIHVMSDEESELPRHHLQSVNVFAKTDIVRSTLRGAVIGLTLAALVLLAPVIFNLTTPIGMIPFIFAAIVVLGFSTWEGGLWGIQEPNSRFKQFFDRFKKGEHLLIVDFNDQQKEFVQKTELKHPSLHPIKV
jgi:hypothetical protein